MTDRPRGRAWQELRRKVLILHHGVCHICGHPGATQVDHVMPLALGGHPTDMRNLRPAHGPGAAACPTCGRKCNRTKSDKPMGVAKTSRQW